MASGVQWDAYDSDDILNPNSCYRKVPYQEATKKPNVYNYFLKIQTPEYKKNNTEITYKEMITQLSAMWKALNDAEKTEYEFNFKKSRPDRDRQGHHCMGEALRYNRRPGRMRYRCKDCGGKSFCTRGRQKLSCKDCGGKSFCPHGRRRSRCKDCGGKGGVLMDRPPPRGAPWELVWSANSQRPCKKVDHTNYTGMHTAAACRPDCP